ncbi:MULTISPECIES: NUDIX domain-containing protein [unclassified Nitratiruptor]|uniref:NUDIX domain-containing protein n=1 Tax=unclassified Nitratiruptor TaxID=2624044 RepID=UPI0019169F96|nr:MULTISPECIES: NUDIX domain-containing protein [unclassified Nitratiruptor]BCD60995.1 hypothetical protein NitYY0810_C1776 [Nitratiruptor sp. YY08-10]BCD64927.1 hypothetical protein NitYY0814_C1784 [Nitratiruptor sp. YY08-14]
MKKSAGILPYKTENGELYVYLGHLGGPFWKRKRRSWGIIKGEVEEGENDLEAAKREFFEETGKRLDGEFLDLGETKTSNKILHIFALQTDLDTDIRSNMVHMEYKGRILEFPEIDAAKWFTIEEAKEVILEAQKVFLERLQQLV